MLSERKRFKYINTKEDESKISKRQTTNVKEQTIQNLQRINRKIVEDTAKQFQQFQRDIQRVENILKEKQDYIIDLKTQNADLIIDLEILSDQISRKDEQIKFLSQQVKDLLKNSQSQLAMIDQISKETDTLNIQICHKQTQTQNQNNNNKQLTSQKKQQLYKNKYEQIGKRAFEMQQEIYQLKEELYNTSSQLSLLRQEFASYKILKQIESVQKNS